MLIVLRLLYEFERWNGQKEEFQLEKEVIKFRQAVIQMPGTHPDISATPPPDLIKKSSKEKQHMSENKRFQDRKQKRQMELLT